MVLASSLCAVPKKGKSLSVSMMVNKTASANPNNTPEIKSATLCRPGTLTAAIPKLPMHGMALTHRYPKTRKINEGIKVNEKKYIDVTSKYQRLMIVKGG